MNEPWFDPNLYAWIPGTALGVLGGIWGTAIGMLAPQGKCRGLLTAGFWLLLIAGMGCLAAGLAALRSGQPYGVWYGLGLPGLIVPCIVGPIGLLMQRRFREAEERRITARDLS